MRITTLVILLVLVLTACTTATRPTSAATPTPDPLSTGAMVKVDLGKYSMFIHCFGTGSPVVVLEEGLGAEWSYWKNVYTGMPGDIRVCVYDRSSSSHTSQQYVEDLHAMLTGAGLQGPYVLVGHSYGGLNVILYAHQYPKDVAGVVLEDIAHPDQNARFLAALPPASPEDSQDLKDTREAFGWHAPT